MMNEQTPQSDLIPPTPRFMELSPAYKDMVWSYLNERLAFLTNRLQPYNEKMNRQSDDSQNPKLLKRITMFFNLESFDTKFESDDVTWIGEELKEVTDLIEDIAGKEITDTSRVRVDRMEHYLSKIVEGAANFAKIRGDLSTQTTNSRIDAYNEGMKAIEVFSIINPMMAKEFKQEYVEIGNDISKYRIS